MTSRQDLITAITTVWSLMFRLQLSLLGNERTRLLKSQGGNPDSRVFPQAQREAQWPSVSALGPDTEHRGDL